MEEIRKKKTNQMTKLKRKNLKSNIRTNSESEKKFSEVTKD